MTEQIVMIDPSVLKVHPRNEEFFDDVNGAEFDRLVESIREHGVLTPLRITKDMTIISGHQRKRAAIEAGLTEIPVIIDGNSDDNEVLTKLIETNFGRMKNDPIKQAKWIKEYEELKGVRQGSAGNSQPHYAAGEISQEDIAKELGISADKIQRLKSLLKLDPAIQALISSGKINATTGFKVLSKLSPEDQKKLLDKLPDDVKFSAKTIETKIEEMREELSGNVDRAMQEADKLKGEKEQLIRENNELRKGALPISAETQDELNKLKQENRDFYEKYQTSEKDKETLRGMLKEYNDRIVELENTMKGGDSTAIAQQNEIDSLRKQLEAKTREANDLEFQLETKEDEINDLKREKKEGYERKALRINETPEQLSQRERDSLLATTQNAIGQFQTYMDTVLARADDFMKIDRDVLMVLIETCGRALRSGEQLKALLQTYCGYNYDMPEDYFTLGLEDIEDVG